MEDILAFLLTNMPIICGISYAITFLILIFSKNLAGIFPLLYSAAVGAFLIYYRYYHSSLHEGTIKTEDDFTCMLGISLFCAMIAGAIFAPISLLEVDSCFEFIYRSTIFLILIPIFEIIVYYLLIFILGLILTVAQGDYSQIIVIMVVIGALTPPTTVYFIVFEK